MAADVTEIFAQVGAGRQPVCLDPPREARVELREEGKPGVLTVSAHRSQQAGRRAQVQRDLQPREARFYTIDQTTGQTLNLLSTVL